MSSHFKELERLWYKKLKDHGFEDIEDVTREDRLLKKWTCSQPAKWSGSSMPKPTFEREERFMQHLEFENVCLSVCKHGNNSFSANEAHAVWLYYCLGTSKREIGIKMGVAEGSIRRLIIKMKSWMEFLSE